MGKITIFAIDDCRHCKRAKAAMTSRKIPYTEISLSSYPQKRTDMLSLSDRLTVPQIFFNARHIGGADELVAVLEGWDADTQWKKAYDAYAKEVASLPNPTDPRLEVPTGLLAKQETAPPPRNESFRLPNGTKGSYLQLHAALVGALPPPTDQKLGFCGVTYKRAFSGAAAVSAILEAYPDSFSTRSDATDYLEEARQSARIVGHVEEESFSDAEVDSDNQNKIQAVAKEQRFVDEENVFFRLRCHFRPHVLNNFRIWTDRVDHTDPNRTVQRLQKLFSKLEAGHEDGDGGVDYVAAAADEHFLELEEASCELQKVDLAAMDETYRKAFVINLYNLAIRHAFLKLGVPTTDLQRATFFSTVSYDIGGHSFTFSQLENGILRCNRKAPFSLQKPFSSTSPKRKFSLSPPLDPRIHFALNCGAKSCPPVKTFTPDSVEEELRIVTLAFHESDDNARVDATTNTLTVSKILKWYRPDFATSTTRLPEAVLPFLGAAAKKELLETMMANNSAIIRVRFFPYDWTSNATRHNTFSKSKIQKNNQRSLLAIFS